MGSVEPIAIIGMMGKFPGADNLDEFWGNLDSGKVSLTDLSDEELLANGEHPDLMVKPNYVRRRPILDNEGELDATLFDITPRDAELRDPQQRLFLEVAHATLEHAGYDPTSYDGRIGVYAGTGFNHYRIDHVEEVPDLADKVGWTAIEVASAPDYTATFVAYKLGLRGPALTVQTACSTSLVAIHVAGSALRAGECEMALAGCADIGSPFHLGYMYAPGGMLARDGVPRPFDKDATGTNFGSGVGAVLLKPLSAAIRDRDTIHAVVLSSSINNDGNRKPGFTAPSVDGQSECITEALRLADVDARTIDYVEMHGTGTVVGDPIEVTALADAFRRSSGAEPAAPYCAIGSVKSNVGHLGQAAGIAGVIKAVLALRHERIPATINLTEPNPAIDWETSPFYLATDSVPWPRREDSPRRCGVSSFGIGGTNSHLILEEPPATTTADPATRPAEALLWSAMDTTSEDQLRHRLAEHFDSLPEASFADAAHTLRVGRTARPTRGAVIASSAKEAGAALLDRGRIIRGDGVDRRVAFAFPGQGAQHPRMLHGLYHGEKLFREGCDAAFDQLEPMIGRDLRSLWLAASTPDELVHTEVTQPLLYVLEYTLAHCLMHWGVRPDVLVGHSLGELVAGAVAGTFGFADGLKVVAARASLMADAPRGRMLAVAAAEEIVLDAVGDLFGAELCVATVNSARQVVLSGSTDAVDVAEQRLRDRKIACTPMRTSHAYHSPMMRVAADKLHKVLSDVRLQIPGIPVISSTTGELISVEQACSPAFWSDQLVNPVRFDAAVHSLVADGPVAGLEVGPGRTLHAILRSDPQVRDAGSLIMACAPKPESSGDDQTALTEALATLWVNEHQVDYWHSEVFAGHRRIPVPGYPYQRERYWIERPRAATQESRSGSVSEPAGRTRPAEPTLPGELVDESGSWSLGHLTWRRHDVVRTDSGDRGQGGLVALALLPSARETAATLGAAFQRASYRTTRVYPQGTDGATRVIDVTSADQWSTLCSELANKGMVPDVIAHSLLADGGNSISPSDVVSSLLAMTKTAATLRRRHRKQITVLVLTRGAVDVTGGDPVDPVAAMASAYVRSVEREIPGIRWVCVDIGDRTSEVALSAELAEPVHPLVALRGGVRWLPQLESLPRRKRTDSPALRHRGVYLITGGLGGIGLVIAQAFGETGMRPRLALLSRGGLPEPGTKRGDHVNAALAAIADTGAETLVVTGDVGDLESLRAAVEEVERRFGQIAGVVHSAGLPGGGLAEQRSPMDAERVLWPKVMGTLNLDEVFAGRPELDFLTLFSSQAAVSGLYGSADYAAANAFMDAYARQASGRERRTISVQWPGWAEIGMAADSAVPLGMLTGAVTVTDRVVQTPDGAEYRRVITPGVDWEFDEHRFLSRRILPGAAMLDLVVTAARKTGTHPGDRPLGFQDVMFMVPAVGDEAMEFRVVMTRVGGMHRFQVLSRRHTGDGEWTEHATGLLTAVDGPPPEPIDPGLMRTRHPSTSVVDLPSWINLGQRWRSAISRWASGDESVCELVLPDEFHDDLRARPLHAALIDAAIIQLTYEEPGREAVPWMYRRLKVFAPLRPRMLVRGRLGPAGRQPRALDCEFFDAQTGEPLVTIEQFTQREQTAARMADTAGPAQPPARADDGLLSPADGAEAFLELLGGACPPVVMVNPPGQLLPVAGAEWVTGEVSPEPSTSGAIAPQPVPAVVPPPAAGVDDTKGAAAPTAADIAGQLRALWEQTLGVGDIQPTDEFFDIGGNSLSAVQLTAMIRDRFGVELEAGVMFELTTIEMMTAELIGLGVR